MASVQSVVQATDTATRAYVENVWQEFDNQATPLILAVATIALVTVGYLMLTGRLRASSPEFISRLLRWAFIFTLLLNMPGVFTVSYNLVTAVPDGIARFLLAQAPAGGLTEAQVVGRIETIMQAGMESAEHIWTKAGYLDLSSHVLAGLLLVTALLLAIVAMTLLMLSNLAVGILLAVGPFFLILRLVDVGKGLFEGWLRQLLTFALVPVFVYSLIALNFTIFTQAQDQLVDATTLNQLTLTQVVPYVLVGIANLLLLTQVLSWAGGVGGGIALAVTAGSVIQGVGQFARASYATGRVATQATVAGVGAAAGAAVRYGPGIIRRMGSGGPW